MYLTQWDSLRVACAALHAAYFGQPAAGFFF